MKEVENKAKKLKAKEQQRLTLLVETAMSLDPRLRRDKAAKAEELAAKKAEKERGPREKAEREAREKAEREGAEAEEAEEEKVRRANMKAKKETEKKALRKMKNLFRKLSLAAYQKAGEGAAGNWEGLESQNDEVEFLAEKLDLDTLPALAESLGTEDDLKLGGIEVVRAAYKATKEGADNAFLAAEKEKARARKDAETREAAEKAARAQRPWSSAELSALKKAAAKYPAGGANRFELIATFVNNHLALPEPRSKDECLKKFNEAMSKVEAAAKEAGAGANKDEEKKVEEKGPAAPVDPNVWIQEEKDDLKAAMKKFPSSMEKRARWTKIQQFVATKDTNQCVQQFKVMKAEEKKKKEMK
jgi:DnaJ family protein C protein 2